MSGVGWGAGRTATGRVAHRIERHLQDGERGVFPGCRNSMCKGPGAREGLVRSGTPCESLWRSRGRKGLWVVGGRIDQTFISSQIPTEGGEGRTTSLCFCCALGLIRPSIHTDRSRNSSSTECEYLFHFLLLQSRLPKSRQWNMPTVAHQSSWCSHFTLKKILCSLLEVHFAVLFVTNCSAPCAVTVPGTEFCVIGKDWEVCHLLLSWIKKDQCYIRKMYHWVTFLWNIKSRGLDNA